ncbi:amidohydrolase family protein [Agreia sp. COWG]|uniref:amidohydrolase family protein n=1 Tax=Agreia sp. COWG TaxID=2773266 RepID=UPI00192586F6|nr:amidohydrolase family protein [Agreia sp. COWG]CAD5995113.1 Cytosine deaminase [Agreia sp. COWG]
MAAPRLLIVGATILPVADDAPSVIRDGWMLVVDGVIDSVGEGAAPAVDASDTSVLDVRGAFVAPGFVSSHSHLFTSGSRGLAVNETLYGWCTAMFAVTGAASPAEIYWCTLHGAFDMLNNGVTTAFDFTDGRLPWEPMIDGRRQTEAPPQELRPLEYLTRQADAKLASGIRFVNSVMIDDSVGGRDEVFARLGEIVEYCEALDRRFMLRVAISGAGQWSPNPECAEIEVEGMRRFGLINQAHLLETREAVELQREKFDRYEAAGALGPDFIFGHFIQTTPDILKRTAEAGANMSWQPNANGRLASGIAAIPAMRERGIRVGMGLDDQACSDISDPFQNMRMGMYAIRATTGDPTGLSTADMLRMHTLGSAEILGIDDRVGSLEPGKFADFVVVDPRSPDVGPLWDPVSSYVLACGLRNLKRVYVGGVLSSVDGEACDQRAAEASRQIHRILPAITTGVPSIGVPA